MKNLLKIIAVLLSVIAVSLSLFSCDLITVINDRQQGSIEDLPKVDVNSVEFANNGETDNTQRDKGNLAEAVEKVYKSAVGVMVKTASGTSYGSGVIVKVNLSDALSGQLNENQFYILTCHHVIASAIDLENDITVFLCDDEHSYEQYQFSGDAVSLVGGDATSDVAVLKLDISNNEFGLKNTDIVCAELMDIEKNQLVYGEEVFAIGNPSGMLPGTVTRGVISYINRRSIVDSVGEMYLLQIDVATNPGSSGGGLYNLYGELVGLTNAGNTNYEGINFAIPLTIELEGKENRGIVPMARQLIASKTENNYGYVEGRWKFGITVSQYSGYVYVSALTSKSICDKAGLKKDDIITAVKYGEKTVEIKSVTDFSEAYADMQATLKLGEIVTLSVFSNRVQTTVDVKLEQYIFNDTYDYLS